MTDREDDFDLTLAEARKLMAGGEPVEIVPPPTRTTFVVSGSRELNGALSVDAPGYTVVSDADNEANAAVPISAIAS